MKSMYWHQKFTSRYVIVGFCIFMILSLYLVENFKKETPQEYFKEKLAASSLTFKSFLKIKKAREHLKIKINPELDPERLGLIGYKSSETTTDPGVLYSKQTSVNPNLAALFIQWFKDAGLEKGDTVAAATSGSFPALNIAMLAAIKTMGLKPLIVFSAGASNYGANIPNFSWPYMYHVLQKDKIYEYQPLAISIGGSRDKGYGLSDKGIRILTDAIKDNGFKLLKLTKPEGTTDSINKRMGLYEHAKGNKEIKAYINVGGGMASIGLKRLKKNDKYVSSLKPKSLKTGLIDSLPITLAGVDSVAVRFLKEGVPVINVRSIHKSIVEKYGFPYKPAIIPLIGTGPVFTKPDYNITLTTAILIIDILALCLVAFLSRKYLVKYKRK